MKRTLLIAVILLSSVLLSYSGAYCSDKKAALPADYINELDRLNTETDEEVAKIGPVEFSSFSELRDIERVTALKRNLKKYWETKRRYFDRLDDLLKTYGGKQWKGSEDLEGNAHRSLEKTEKKYVAALDKFYDLILHNHNKMSFEEGQIYLDDESLVIELNTLWTQAVRSTRELVAALN